MTTNNDKYFHVTLNATDVAQNNDAWLLAQIQADMKSQIGHLDVKIESFEYVHMGFCEEDQSVTYLVKAQLSREIKGMTVRDRLLEMGTEELLTMYHDAEALNTVFVLSLDAPLRKFAEEFFDNEPTNVLQMTHVANEVYRLFANMYYDSHISQEEL